jgi:uncharacterized membrane protein
VDNFLHITAVWVHILGIALFVGPQFFLAFAWVPASRQIADLVTRAQAMRTITRRFGYIGGIGLVLILVAGTYLIATWRDFYGYPDDAGFTDVRYGVIFIIKMSVLIVMLVLVGLHMFWAGPRQLALMEAQARGEAVGPEELRRQRMLSMTLSIAGLVLTLAIMVMGVSLSTTEYSFQET